MSRGGRPRRCSDKSGRGAIATSGVVEFGTFTIAFSTETARPRSRPAVSGGRRAEQGRRKPQACVAKLRGVGRGHGTREVAEDEGNARRGDGGTGLGQGKICCTKRLLDTGRARGAHDPAADRKASKRKARREAHQPAQPHQGAAAARGVPTPQGVGGARSGWGHVGRVWRAPRRAPARSPRPHPSWQLPPAAGQACAHSER